METYWFDSLPSTQTHAVKLIRSGALQESAVIAAKMQTGGIGSRNNIWQGRRGNLFCSIVTPIKHLPADLKLQSASLYFGFLAAQTLQEYKSRAWLKWPNDIYLDHDKIGGLICWQESGFLIAGLGLNLHSHGAYRGVDIDIGDRDFLTRLVKAVEKKPGWKEIFSKFRLEFSKSKQFSMHYGDEKVALARTSLQEDGSLIYQGKRIYSLR